MHSSICTEPCSYLCTDVQPLFLHKHTSPPIHPHIVLGLAMQQELPDWDLVVLVKEKHLFFSRFYTGPPKVIFLINQTLKSCLGRYLTASQQAVTCQHGRSCHPVNGRSTLGIFTSRRAAEPAPRRVFGSTGVAGRQGTAEPGSSALHLSSTPAHLTCPVPTTSHHYSCLSSLDGE